MGRIKKEGFKQCEVMVTRARTAIIYDKGGRMGRSRGGEKKKKSDLMTDLLIEIELQEK